MEEDEGDNVAAVDNGGSRIKSTDWESELRMVSAEIKILTEKDNRREDTRYHHASDAFRQI